MQSFEEVRDFFKISEPKPCEETCKQAIKRLATTSASGQILNALLKEDKFERRMGCKAVVNQQRVEALPVRLCLLEKAKAAISMQ